MKIRFLGTGAADWAEPVNGEFRALSSTLFDEKLLIDGTMMVRDRIAHPEKITDMLLTHPHRDHFDLVVDPQSGPHPCACACLLGRSNFRRRRRSRPLRIF